MAEVIGTRLHHFIHPADCKTYRSVCQQLQRRQYPSLRLEHRLLRRSGESHWVITRFTLLPDSGGDEPCIAFTIEDIDQRKQLEMHLRHRVEQERVLTKLPKKRCKLWTYSKSCLLQWKQCDNIFGPIASSFIALMGAGPIPIGTPPVS